MSINPQRVAHAIKDTRESLAAAGFSIEIGERGGLLSFAVKPGPEACPECLVPKAVFEDILGRELAEGGIQPASFELAYPLDEDDA